MKIRIETWGECSYQSISREYGKVLEEFGLENIDEKPWITLNSFDELFDLHEELDKYNDERGYCFFGIMTESDIYEGERYLLIKDNYD